jgi:hypothetical protein
MSSILSKLINLAGNISGTLGITNGGTGQITANSALNALLPSQTGNATKVLQTDATNTSWAAVATLPISTDNVIGSSTGLAAASGYIGQVISASQTTATNVPASGTYGDGLSIVLPSAGVFRIDAYVIYYRNGATLVTSEIATGVSTTSGNSSTDIGGASYGINATSANGGSVPNIFANYPQPNPSFTVRYNGTTITKLEDGVSFAAGSTLYLKLYFNNYSVATPQWQGKISATRIH